MKLLIHAAKEHLTAEEDYIKSLCRRYRSKIPVHEIESFLFKFPEISKGQLEDLINKYKKSEKAAENLDLLVDTPLPYYFHYTADNPTFAYDFQRKASELGCIKVRGRYMNIGSEYIFYLCPSESAYHELSNFNNQYHLVNLYELHDSSNIKSKYPHLFIMK